jgi:hypothetical protein
MQHSPFSKVAVSRLCFHKGFRALAKDMQNDLCQVTELGREGRVPTSAYLSFMAINSGGVNVHNIPVISERCPVVHGKTRWRYGIVTICIKKNGDIENCFLAYPTVA